MLSALVSLLVLGAASSAHPLELLEDRSGDGCNANNVLRSFRATQRLADTLPFCSGFLGLPKVTETAAFVPTASVTIFSYTTITETVHETATKTLIDFEKRAIETPSFIETQSLSPSEISSACNCLTIPLATTTVRPQGVTTFSKSATETETIYVTETKTETVTAPTLVLAHPTSVAGFPIDSPAQYDADDTNYRIELGFKVELYGFQSSLIFASINGLLWLDELSQGDFQYYFGDNGAALPLSTDYLPDIAILPFWSDLKVNGGAVQGVFYEITGSSGSKVITFEYIVSDWEEPSEVYHFTISFAEAKPNKVNVKFYEAFNSQAGTVALQYKSANKALVYSRKKNLVTVGLELEFDTAAGTISS